MPEHDTGPVDRRENATGPATGSPVVSIESVQELAGVAVSGDEIDLSPLGLDHLDPGDVDFLDEQTRRTLDRHAEIQHTQRGQAARLLRTTVAITGLLLTLLLFLRSFLVGLSFESTVAGWRFGLAFVLVVTTIVLVQKIAAGVYLLVETSVDVLSPEATQRGSFGSLLTILNVIPPETHDEEARSSVRAVSILDELAPHVDDPGDGLELLVIRNRLNRVRRNENVIDRNTERLHDAYQRAKYVLERGLATLVSVALALFLFGARL